MAQRRFAVLDRDGTIMMERHYLTDPDRVELIPGAARGLRELREMGLGLILATNQSVVGRGLLDPSCLGLIHQRLLQLLHEEGVHLEGIYVCPHKPEDHCRCRKPETGLMELAAQELGFDPKASFVIGDKACDIELGKRVGATTFLVRTGYGEEFDFDTQVNPDHVVDDLREGARLIQHLLTIREDMGEESSEKDRLGNRVRTHLSESAQIHHRIAESGSDSILAAADLIAETFRSGGKVLLCGNGGSAADCQHMAAEFVSRLSKDFERPGLPAIALTTDTSFLTAFTNDCGFENVFERQVKTLGHAGDLLIGISTSGNSINVIHAVKTATCKGMKTLVLTGASGSLMELGNVAISVPSKNTQYIQETHLTIEHILCDLVEDSLFEKRGLEDEKP